jgi:glutamate-ammonia-ligase adenylyltransferase
MTFASRLTRTPIAFDQDSGQEARRRFADQPPEIVDLLAGAAGSSPHLRGLMDREAEWLREALATDPEAALAGALAGPEAAPLSGLGAALRVAKRRVGLLTGLCDLGGVWTLEEVTGALTALADRAVHLSLRALVGEEIRRDKIPGAVAQDADRGAGMVVLAMGKMGAGELNYSSDIDLICLFDETRFAPDDFHDARAAFIRVTRRICAMLSDLTGEGYVFRTDLRLRPDAAVTPVCMSMDAAERYYESMGRTWERAAYIKARPCAGDIAAGERFLKSLTPFVWRKHLDFAAIQDAHDMRLRIRDHRGLHGAICLEGHNMKLGQGGIREIEFFTQTRQIIAGGRDPDLRDVTTVGGLARLAEKGWIPDEVAQELATIYRAHREVEHRIQMVHDSQTHDLPTTPEGFDRLARLCGEGDTAAWRAGILDRLHRVAALTEDFFAPDAQAGRDEEALAQLSDSARDIVEGWRAYPALRSERAVEIFKRVRPEILRRLARAAHTDEALVQFDGFLRGLPAGVQLFSLFEANPELTRLIVDIAATAPGLAQYLSRNSGVLDAVIGGDFFAPWPGMAALRAELTARLSEVADYEARLDTARRWAKEWHFRVGVHHLRGLIDAFEAGSQYADLAEAVVASVWVSCCAEFARKHGAAPGRGAVVLGMGSLGAGRLNAGSDLDLIVIYDADGAEGSDGPRPLAARPYYARLTQALITALTAPTAEGRLYEVDMRLRPSGRQGPVATSIGAFRAYQQDEAWTWEHLALTRARPVAGTDDLAAEVEAFRADLLAAKGKGPTVVQDTAAMRARLHAAKPGTGAWEAKQGPGRMQDIELLAQAAALVTGSPARRVEAQLRAGVRAGWLTAAGEAAIMAAYRLCWRVQAASRLLSDTPLDLAALGEGATAFVLHETETDSATALAAEMAARCGAAAQVIAQRLATSTGDNNGKSLDAIE